MKQQLPIPSPFIILKENAQLLFKNIIRSIFVNIQNTCLLDDVKHNTIPGNSSKSNQLTGHCSSFRNQQTFNDVIKTSKCITSVIVIYFIDLYLI